MLILLLGLTLLLLLGTARHALEPVCPNCSLKSWGPHSTQLHCTGCGWSNGQIPLPAVGSEQAQYELCAPG